MKCPTCGEAETRVIDSRPANGGESIRRRRECPKCTSRFTTFEILEQLDKVVVKRDGRRVAYARDRLLSGISKACRKRPVTPEQVEAIVAFIEKEVFRPPASEATTEQIGRLVLKRLKDIDQVAYVRFASVYKQFRDLHDFNTEIKSLLKD